MAFSPHGREPAENGGASGVTLSWTGVRELECRSESNTNTVDMWDADPRTIGS